MRSFYRLRPRYNERNTESRSASALEPLEGLVVAAQEGAAAGVGVLDPELPRHLADHSVRRGLDVEGVAGGQAQRGERFFREDDRDPVADLLDLECEHRLLP